jgi:hypothetical protein
MTIKNFVLLSAAICLYCGCNSRYVLTHKANNGDTTAIVNLAQKLYTGNTYFLYSRRPHKKTTKPLEAIEYLKKGDSLHSVAADYFLHEIKNDSFILWHDYDVFWYFTKKLLVIRNDYNAIVQHDKSLLAIAPEVKTLIVINPNGSVDDENKYQLINHSNYQMYSNLDTLFWIGDDYDYINKVPENALGLTNLKQLYILNMTIDSTISKQFYSFNPTLKIDLLYWDTIDKRLIKSINYAYPH